MIWTPFAEENPLITCEACVEGIPGALAAQSGGAHRIELCAGLVEGCTTPSGGTVSMVLRKLAIPTVVLVRPRGGDFLYSTEEMEGLLRDVEAIRKSGAFGIATGMLTADGRVDTEAMGELMKVAGPLSVTFHRAFDMVRDPFEALSTLVDLGVHRILTSGQDRTVLEGMSLIGGLVKAAGSRISIMPGGGIRAGNVRRIVEETGVREVHFTGFKSSESLMVHRNTRPLMGSDRVPGEYERLGTDAERVRGVVQAVRSIP